VGESVPEWVYNAAMPKPIEWTTVKVKLSALQEWEKNPVKISDQDAQQLAISMAKYRGVLPYVAAGPVVKGEYPLLDGHQRKKVEIEINKIDPDSIVDVRVPSRRLTEAERAEIVIRLRKNTGIFDDALLLEHFKDFPLLEWGFTDLEFIESIGDAVSGIEKKINKTNRNIPLDIIYTLQMADVTCCLAVQAGWLYGINSAHYRICPYTHYLSGRHEVAFVDNDYLKYDHGKHLEAVKIFKPKYCTVRDIMSERQCKESNITWYPFSQIMEWAEELSKYAKNVIVIPKYDCIKDIPKKFVLGYSIPTTHGGTPLSIELFRGRKIHLLGGAWKDQILYLDNFGDDVVSLDNNHVANIARFGQVELGDGRVESIQKLEPQLDLNNPRYFSLALSFGTMAKYIQDNYKGNVKAENEILRK
jgi:hypothetical protein